MRQEKIQSIRNTLVKKMEELRLIADDTISKMRNAEDEYPDPFDRAAIESSKYVELACRDRERRLILDIKETIIRIDWGLFGICDSCGKAICEKRLLIEPMSRLCIDCQKKIEIINKHRFLGVGGVSCNHAC
ncbi:MAG: TraR/DksA C4-type zinc finger protein [Clostridiaceae bacterium]